MTTRHPFAASSLAVAAPIPLDAPETTAVRAADGVIDEA
jgi:hypothetical protein